MTTSKPVNVDEWVASHQLDEADWSAISVALFGTAQNALGDWLSRPKRFDVYERLKERNLTQVPIGKDFREIQADINGKFKAHGALYYLGVCRLTVDQKGILGYYCSLNCFFIERIDNT